MLKSIATAALLFATCMGISQAMAEAHVKLHAAGSLKSAMGELADAFEAGNTVKVERSFGPSGLLRERIERGEKAEVFASANMKHPTILASTGKAAPVVLFARNRLCALAQPGVEVDSASLLQVMLGDDIRVGTSTPKADPSGDYAFQVFEKAGVLVDGATEKLKAKALKLTGGKDSEKAPEGRNTYGWVMEGDKADIFLTYWHKRASCARRGAGSGNCPAAGRLVGGRRLWTDGHGGRLKGSLVAGDVHPLSRGPENSGEIRLRRPRPHPLTRRRTRPDWRAFPANARLPNRPARQQRSVTGRGRGRCNAPATPLHRSTCANRRPPWCALHPFWDCGPVPHHAKIVSCAHENATFRQQAKEVTS